MDKELYIKRYGMFYTNSNQEGIWIQGDKESIAMGSMDEIHLKRCISKVKGDIRTLKEHAMPKSLDVDRYKIALELMPIAQNVLQQLKNEYSSRI